MSRLYTVAYILALYFHSYFAGNCRDPINCYLSNVQLQVPSTKILIHGSSGYLYLTDLNIHQIVLDSVGSSTHAALNVNIDARIQAVVTGQYRYGIAKGTLTGVVQHATESIDVFVMRSFDDLPELSNVSAVNCRSTIAISLQFTGFFGPLLDVATLAAQKYISHSAGNAICLEIQDFVSLNLSTFLLQDLDPMLRRLKSTSNDVPPIYHFDTINWWQFWNIHGHHERGVMLNLVGNVVKLFGFRDIWSFIVSQLLDISGNIVIPLKITIPFPQNAELHFDKMTVVGLRNSSGSHHMHPSKTFNTSWEFHYFLSETIVIFDVTVTAAQPTGYFEKMQLRVQLKDLSFSGRISVAVSTDIYSLYLPQARYWSCLAGSTRDLFLSTLDLKSTIQSVFVTNVRGDAQEVEVDLVSLVDNILSRALEDFKTSVTTVIEGVFQGPIRHAINHRLAELTSYFEHISKRCPPYDPRTNSGEGSYVWSQDFLFQTVSSALQNLRASDINEFIGVLSNGTGRFSLFDRKSDVEISASGLDSVYALSLLQSTAKEPFDVITQFGLGSCQADHPCTPMTFTITLHSRDENVVTTSGNSNGNPLARRLHRSLFVPASKDNATTVVTRIYNFLVIVDAKLMLNRRRVDSLTIGDILSRAGKCLLSSFDEISFADITLKVGRVNIQLNDARSVDITKAAHLDLPIASKIMREVINAKLNHSLQLSRRMCVIGTDPPVDPRPHPPQDSFRLSSTTLALITLLAAGVAVMTIMILVTRVSGSRSETKARVISPSERNSSYELLEDTAVNSDEDVSPVGKDTTPLKSYNIFSSCTAWASTSYGQKFCRSALAQLIVLNIFLFANSNMSVGVVIASQLDIYSSSGDVTHYRPPPIFDFSLQSSVNEMWEAKVYVLAVVVAFFSGGWPYLKLCFMLGGLVLPDSILSAGRKQTLLEWTDLLGKWSLVDFFVTYLFMCAFYFTVALEFPEQDLFQKILVHSFVLPQWGIIGFVLATIMSQVMGCLTLAFHRSQHPKTKQSHANLIFQGEVESVHRGDYRDSPCVPTAANGNGGLIVSDSGLPSAASVGKSVGAYFSLSRHCFTVPVHFLPHSSCRCNVSDIALMKVTVSGQIIVGVFLFACLALLVFASLVHTFDFQITGLTGFLLGEGAVARYSVFKIGITGPSGTSQPHSISAIFLESVFFVFASILPVLTLLLIAVLWFLPFPVKYWTRILFLLEISSAWSAIDVFILAVSAAFLEIRQFAAFIVGHSCDGINAIIDEYFGDQLKGDHKCFGVITGLEKTYYLLILAAVLLFLVGLSSVSLATLAIHQREEISGEVSTSCDIQIPEDAYIVGERELSELSEPLLRVQRNESVKPYLLKLFISVLLFCNIVEIADANVYD